jgi:shikimate kinase
MVAVRLSQPQPRFFFAYRPSTGIIYNFGFSMMRRSEQPLRIALIGMSGAGKSHWTKNLAAGGHPVVCCDDQIEARLAPVLKAGGYSGINGVAAWMGWPDSPTYLEREAQYLSEEISTVDEVLSDLEKDSHRELILDTSGSVIYSGNNILMRLRRQMTVIYLAASEDEQQLLIRRYLQDPKPVLWRGAFQPRPGETPHDTVARCYPALISARRQSYEALAHFSISTVKLRELSPPGTSRNAAVGETFLETVRQMQNQRA